MGLSNLSLVSLTNAKYSNHNKLILNIITSFSSSGTLFTVAEKQGHPAALLSLGELI